MISNVQHSTRSKKRVRGEHEKRNYSDRCRIDYFCRGIHLQSAQIIGMAERAQNRPADRKTSKRLRSVRFTYEKTLNINRRTSGKVCNGLQPLARLSAR